MDLLFELTLAVLRRIQQNTLIYGYLRSYEIVLGQTENSCKNTVLTGTVPMPNQVITFLQTQYFSIA